MVQISYPLRRIFTIYHTGSLVHFRNKVRSCNISCQLATSLALHDVFIDVHVHPDERLLCYTTKQFIEYAFVSFLCACYCVLGYLYKTTEVTKPLPIKFLRLKSFDGRLKLVLGFPVVYIALCKIYLSL